MLDQSSQKNNATKMLAGLFGSSAFDETWGRYHRSERDENPGPDIVKEFQADDFPGSPEERAALYTLLSRYVEVNKDALGEQKPEEDPKVSLYRNRLKSLHAYLSNEIGQAPVPFKNLPEEYQKIIDMAEMETAMDPVRPVGAVKDFAMKIIHHFDEFRQDKPVLFYGLGATAATFVTMAYWKIGDSSAPYIDPEMLFDNNLSANSFLDLDKPHVPNVDYDAMNASDLSSIKLPCHDHLDQMFGDTWLDTAFQKLNDGQTIAQSGAKLFGDDSTFLIHCGKLKTIAAETTAFADSFTSGWSERIAPIVEGLGRTTSETAYSAGPHREAFLDGVNLAAGGVYWFDNWENLVIHLSLLGMGFVGTARTGVMDHEEAKESRDIIKNFLYRIAKNNPLNYVFAAAGIGAVAYSGNSAESIVISGLAGLTAGYLTHRFMRSANRQKTALNQVQEMDVSLHLDNTASDTVVLTSSAESMTSENEHQARLPLHQRHKRKLITTGALAAAASVDSVVTGGYYTHASLGFTSVMVSYVPANVVQDNISHVVFLGAGCASALATVVLPYRASQGAKKAVKSFSTEAVYNMDEAFPFDTDSYYARQIYEEVEKRLDLEL